MTGKLKIEIVESVETLSKLLEQEKNSKKKEFKHFIGLKLI